MDNAILQQEGPWVVEWCSIRKQKGIFHIDTLASVARKNAYVFLGQGIARYTTPWLIIGVFNTNEEAHAFCDKAQQYQAQRGQEPDDDRIFIPVTEDPIEVQRLRTM